MNKPSGYIQQFGQIDMPEGVRPSIPAPSYHSTVNGQEHPAFWIDITPNGYPADRRLFTFALPEYPECDVFNQEFAQKPNGEPLYRKPWNQ